MTTGKMSGRRRGGRPIEMVVDDLRRLDEGMSSTELTQVISDRDLRRDIDA